MAKHKSEDYKITAVKYYLRTNKLNKTCEIFNCSERSLKRWINKYKTYNNIKRKSRKYIAYKVSKEHVNYLLKIINKNKSITIKELHSNIIKQFPNLKISKMHIYRILIDNNISLKQTRLRHEPIKRFNKPIDIKKLLKEFYKNISKYKLSDIICIDETSLKSFETKKHCYEIVGKRCTIKTNNQEVFKKYTGIFAISTKGTIGYTIYDKGGITSDRLITFLKKYIGKNEIS